MAALAAFEGPRPLRKLYLWNRIVATKKMCWALLALGALVIFILGIIFGRKCTHRQEGAHGRATGFKPKYNDEKEEEERLRAEIALGIVGQDVFMAKYSTVVHLSEACQGFHLTKRENIRKVPVCLHCLKKRRKRPSRLMRTRRSTKGKKTLEAPRSRKTSKRSCST